MNALTVVPTYNAQLPAFLRSPDLFGSASGLTGGITGGQPPTISIKGSKWALLEANGETLYVQQMHLDVIVVGGNRHVSKTFYAGPYDPNNSGPPDCWSDNGQAPSSQASAPQSASCALCPKAAFGSKISEATGAGVKACGDSKKLAVVLAAATQCVVNGAMQVVQPFQEVYLLRLPAMSMRPWKEFAEGVEKHGVPVKAGIVIRLAFDPTVSYPKIAFTAASMTTEEQYNGFKQHVDSDAAKQVAGANDAPLSAGGQQPQQSAPASVPPAPATTPSTIAASAPALASTTFPTLPATTAAAATAEAPARRRRQATASAAPPAAQAQTVQPQPASPAPLFAQPVHPPQPMALGNPQNGAIVQPAASSAALDATLDQLFNGA